MSDPNDDAAAAAPTGHEPSWVPIPVAEELDLYSAPELRDTLLKAVNAGDVHIVLDLSETTFVDSSGFAVIVSAYKRVRAQGGQMRVAGAGTSVLSAMRISGLDRVLTLFPDVVAATAPGPAGAPADDARASTGSTGA
jgi:anti-sigma B factor antagonist